MIAIDTSSFARYLSREADRTIWFVVKALDDKSAVLPPAALTELLSNPHLAEDLREVLLQLPLLPILPGYWQRAGDLRAQLLRGGRKAKLADCLIAQACIDNGAPLITYDRDFRHFEEAGLKLL